MNALPLRPRPARDVIDAAIAAHGPARVLVAALAAMLRPRARPPDRATLPPRLRRDVGLDELPAPLPSGRVDPMMPALRDFGPRI
jgi:hypothetical protein